MTHKEIFDLGVGGSDELRKIIEILAKNGNYCLIGGLALNCYLPPVYTEDADFSIAATEKDKIKRILQAAGAKVKENNYDMSVFVPNSRLTIHITTDEKYKDFPTNAQTLTLFGESPVKVACLTDLIKGKTWCFNDPCRKVSKRYKDRADLCRIGESYPDLIKYLPREIQEELNIQLRNSDIEMDR